MGLDQDRFFLKRFKIPISAAVNFELYFVIEMTKCNEEKTEKKM